MFELKNAMDLLLQLSNFTFVLSVLSFFTMTLVFFIAMIIWITFENEEVENFLINMSKYFFASMAINLLLALYFLAILKMLEL